MANISYLLLISGLLLFLSALASKVSERIGIPSLLMFLAVGMVAGSEGIGGIYFDDPLIANFVGTAALAYILFSGGLDTNWLSIRPVLGRGLLLSTLGVGVTALVLALFVWGALGFTFAGALLLSAIVSSTDAAAVFAVLRSRGVSLKGNLRPLLELEAGSNDPMAVFLTIGLIQILTASEASYGHSRVSGNPPRDDCLQRFLPIGRCNETICPDAPLARGDGPDCDLRPRRQCR